MRRKKSLRDEKVNILLECETRKISSHADVRILTKETNGKVESESIQTRMKGLRFRD